MTRARCAATSPALREAAHVALGAALDERELRSAVGAGADEVLRGTSPLADRRVGSGDARRDGSWNGRHRAAQEVLLDALLLLHPFLDRDADRVGDREHFVRSEPDESVGGGASHLTVRDAGRESRARACSCSSSAIRPSASASASLPSPAAWSCTFFAVDPVDSTCISRAPSRYTVTPLQPSL